MLPVAVKGIVMPKKKPSPKSSSSSPEIRGVRGDKCVACSGKGSSSSGSRCLPCGGTGKRKPAPSFPGVEKKEKQDLSKCEYCSKPSLYNRKTKKFVGCCIDCTLF